MASPTIETAAGRRRPAEPGERIRWIPRHHGAWAMLAVPLLLGVAASEPAGSQLLLAAAAVAAYLASAAALDWVRARRAAYGIPAATFGAVTVAAGAVLLASHPDLVAMVAWALMATTIAAAAAIAGRPRSLVVSLAQVAQALALVPAAALVTDRVDGLAVARATCVAAVYLVGSVLLVRSMIRERGRAGFLGVSIAFHLAAVAVVGLVLAWPYAVVTAGLAIRAAAMPALQRLLGPGPHRLRPIHIGLAEMFASAAVVAVALAVGF